MITNLDKAGCTIGTRLADQFMEVYSRLADSQGPKVVGDKVTLTRAELAACLGVAASRGMETILRSKHKSDEQRKSKTNRCQYCDPVTQTCSAVTVEYQECPGCGRDTGWCKVHGCDKAEEL